MNTSSEFDLIIVGAGTAGLTCAIAAAEKDIKILVLEKTAQAGGTLHYTAGHMSAGGTKRQQSRGISDSPELHYQDVMRINDHSADPLLVRLACEEAPKTIDWLDDLGFEFDESCPAIINGHVPYQIPRTHWGKDKGISLLKVLMPLWEKAIQQKRITLHFQHTLIDLILDENNVRGVRCQTAEGPKEYFSSKLGLTTGGYGSNHDFFSQKHPHLSRLITSTAPASMGEGIQVAEKCGAVFHNAEKHIATLGGIELQHGSGRTDFWATWARMSNSIDRPPYEIYVNAQGNRFLNENESNPDVRERAVAAQEGRKCWVIFDEEALQNSSPLIYQWSLEKFKEESLKGEVAWQAESLEGLAFKTGLPPDNLIKSMEQYNQAVRQQKDEAFGRTFLKNEIKTAPYYAIVTYAFSLITFGGIRVNQHLQLVHQQGHLIGGLYGAGELLGAGALSGNAFCGGMLLTPALSLGRYMGKELTKNA